VVVVVADKKKEKDVDSDFMHEDNKEEMEEEWEAVEVEYESEVEEPFGREYSTDPWYLSAGDKEKYKDMFVKADANQDGIVDGPEAQIFFKQSKLPQKDLSHIWNVVDLDKKGYLGHEQFYAMFHIVVKMKGNHMRAPETLPKCLHPDVIGSIGTTVTKRVKKTRTEKKRTYKPKKATTTTMTATTITTTTKNSPAPPAAEKMDNDMSNDWDNFPAFEPGNETMVPEVKLKEAEKEDKLKEKEAENKPVATAGGAGEDQEWANFDF